MKQISFITDRGAVIDPTGQYRYSLIRSWAIGEWITWIMLNPSTADADVDDPTIRRCINFTKMWGFCGMQVVNLYAYRATDPIALKSVLDPIGPDHSNHFVKALKRGSLTIAAWGACSHASTVHVDQLLARYQVKCLGKTRNGSPKHPLYVRANAPLEVWREVTACPRCGSEEIDRVHHVETFATPECWVLECSMCDYKGDPE